MFPPFFLYDEGKELFCLEQSHVKKEGGSVMTFRDRIHPQLRAWYDASGGFDFDHLEEFVARCNAAELANLKEDPLVKVCDRMIPGPENAPEVKVRIYEPANRDGVRLKTKAPFSFDNGTI